MMVRNGKEKSVSVSVLRTTCRNVVVVDRELFMCFSFQKTTKRRKVADEGEGDEEIDGGIIKKKRVTKKKGKFFPA